MRQGIQITILNWLLRFK